MFERDTLCNKVHPKVGSFYWHKTIAIFAQKNNFYQIVQPNFFLFKRHLWSALFLSALFSKLLFLFPARPHQWTPFPLPDDQNRECQKCLHGYFGSQKNSWNLEWQGRSVYERIGLLFGHAMSVCPAWPCQPSSNQHASHGGQILRSSTHNTVPVAEK